MLKNAKRKLIAAVASAGTVLAGASAHAVSVVDAGVTSQIADTQADILTVGSALIGLAVVAMGIKWVKASFF